MNAPELRIADPECALERREIDVIREHLPLTGARVLELGCGTAAMTRLIAENFAVDEIVATEVDAIQHARNLAAEPIPRVVFRAFGAEHIDAADASFDCVMMFKSLHHVPAGAMDAALAEIARVLRPGGLAYISEPVFAGEYNEILRLFHDEKLVREAAFAALGRALRMGLLGLREQLFFLARNRFQDFAEFERRVLQVTHTEHRIDASLFARIKSRFESHVGADGADFRMPMRVDLLEKPGY